MNSYFEVDLATKIVTVFYKGNRLMRSPVNFGIDGVLKQKPKPPKAKKPRQPTLDKYQDRLARWQERLNQRIIQAVCADFYGTLYADELNAKTQIKFVGMQA